MAKILALGSVASKIFKFDITLRTHNIAIYSQVNTGTLNLMVYRENIQYPLRFESAFNQHRIIFDKNQEQFTKFFNRSYELIIVAAHLGDIEAISALSNLITTINMPLLKIAIISLPFQYESVKKRKYIDDLLIRTKFGMDIVFTLDTDMYYKHSIKSPSPEADTNRVILTLSEVIQHTLSKPLPGLLSELKTKPGFNIL